MIICVTFCKIMIFPFDFYVRFGCSLYDVWLLLLKVSLKNMWCLTRQWLSGSSARNTDLTSKLQRAMLRACLIKDPVGSAPGLPSTFTVHLNGPKSSTGNKRRRSSVLGSARTCTPSQLMRSPGCPLSPTKPVLARQERGPE